MTAAPPESQPALGVVPPLQPAPAQVARARRPLAALPAGSAAWWASLALAALLCFASFYGKAGLKLAPTTTVEMALTIGAGLVIAFVALRMPTGARAFGLGTVLALATFAALTAVSLVWSVQPDGSWRDADRMLAYTAVFAAAVALARLAPTRWPAVLAGVTIASVVVCAYALVTKVFPGDFPGSHDYARLYEPFEYWNATGLTAAIGVIGCMWLGARRAGHALLSALAYPAMGLLLSTLLLAYSRGSLVALAIGLVLWFALVPLRLRGAAVLIAGGLGAAIVATFDFTDHSLSAEGVGLAERTSAGHGLGALIAAVLLALTLTGVAVTFATARRAPSPGLRRRTGAALLAMIALALVAFAAALAHSHRGFTGSISHALHSLTDTHAKVPNTPGRLTAIASVRAQYWDQALKVFAAHPVAGVGASGYETARLRYRTSPITVKHAHGFFVQTLADLGLLGTAFALALLLAWMAAAGRATHPFDRSWGGWRELLARRRPAWRRVDEPYGPERIGMLSLLCVVVVFGAHSLIDWTWYVPADACAALLCAGWLAGRGPLLTQSATSPPSPPASPSSDVRGLPIAAGEPHTSRMRLLLAGAAVAGALLVAWAQWQPQRSEEAREAALYALGSDTPAALADARAAVSRDPLSVEALSTLATVQAATGHVQLARATLQKAVRLQPSNPQTWLALGRFDLERDPAAAVKELQASIYLNPAAISAEALERGDPEAIAIHNQYIQALRAVAAGSVQAPGASLVPGAAQTPGAPARPSSPTTTAATRPPAKTAPARHSRAALAEIRARRLLRELTRRGSRSRRAAP